ncbi:DUF6976 family protein [Derxia gummosa]|uniref:DUF6976 family protein n=1 Tax=Derxia gummosa DSM 723 TaxID=1121388 RepID=A0A8B6X732_9BURK|nr:hypothetical protein [Derxia gummosa]
MIPAMLARGGGVLVSVEEAAERLRTGRFHAVAADETALRRLPAGNWIGGSIPYFMGPDGGEAARDKVFLTEIRGYRGAPEIRRYDLRNIARICEDAPDNGWSILILPAFTALHSAFAHDAPDYADMYTKPLAGWIAGVHLDDLGQRVPLVVDGRSLTFDAESAMVMHIALPPDRHARIDTINVFEPGPGEGIRFPKSGFIVEGCEVDGLPVSFAGWLSRHRIDTRLPLVADYCGARINVSIKRIDQARGTVEFYAPVFEGVEYRVASPVQDWMSAFRAVLPRDLEAPAFSCNCILNYLYGGLEGQRTGPLTGPITFGEIAYQLVNQTLVHVSIEG